MMLNVFLTYRFPLILSGVLTFHSVAFRFLLLTVQLILSSKREARGKNTHTQKN